MQTNRQNKCATTDKELHNVIRGTPPKEYACGRRENSFEGPPGELVVGEEHTIVARYVQAPFESPEGVHLLDRRVIRLSQVAHGERAQCELRGNGPVVPTGNHRQDVPSVRIGGRDDAHFQGVDLRPDNGARQLPASREQRFQASSEVGMRTPGPVRGSTRRGRREHQRRFQVVVLGGGQLPVGRSEEETRRPKAAVPFQGVLLPS